MGVEMRKFIYIVAVTIVFSCAIVIVSCDSDSETDDASVIEINGNSLTLPNELSILENVFGEWDRVCDRGNGVYVWDEIGMWVMTPQEETTTDWITIFFKPPIECSPKKMFEGTLQIEDFEINSETTSNDLIQEGYDSLYHQIDIDHYRIDVDFDRVEGNLSSVTITVMYSNM